MPGGGVAPVVITGTTDTSRVEAPITFKAYVICAFAAFGGIFFGYDTGWMGGVLAMPYFINQYTGLPYPDPSSPNYTADKAAFALPASNQSLLTSILSLGTFLGALIAGDCADFTGRRTTIIAGCFIFTVGCILEVASTGLGVMVAGRVICGLGVGFISAIVILYMAVSIPEPPLTHQTWSNGVLGNRAQESSWRSRVRISILRHHRNSARQLRCLCHTKSHGYRIIPYTCRRAIFVGRDPGNRSCVPPRVTALFRQEREAREGCEGTLFSAGAAS